MNEKYGKYEPLRFEIDPVKVVEALNETDMKGLDFIGLFHSDRALAATSLKDISCMLRSISSADFTDGASLNLIKLHRKA